jgi:hypothetical protein
MKYHQGKFKPENPRKYKGDPSNIVYRSSWEFTMMRRLDRDKDVIAWASEELVIPYISPIDERVHRYFPDFVYQTKEGTFVVEIKPEAQTKQPIKGKKKKKTFANEVITYEINSAKWRAAKEFCEDRKLKFVILTERDLYGKK